MLKKGKGYKNNSRKVFFRTFRYQMNAADSEVIEGLLERERGKQIFPEREDVMIFRKNN